MQDHASVKSMAARLTVIDCVQGKAIAPMPEDNATLAHEMSVPRAAEMSLEEWYALPEDEPGELVDGRLVEEEVSSYVHEFLVLLLGRAIGDWVLPRGGVLGGSNAKLGIGPRRGRKPDLTVYFPESKPPPATGIIKVPPDIAVEIVSASPRDVKRDRVEKMDDYAAFGIQYYWIVDPVSHTLEIFELQQGCRYVRVLAKADGTIEPIPGCEGLAIDLDSLWHNVQRLNGRSNGV